LGLTTLEELRVIKSALGAQVSARFGECVGEGLLELDLAELELDELPDELRGIPWLHVIDLNGNELRMDSLRASLLSKSVLPELRSASLKFNCLVGPLPTELGELSPHMEELSFEGNLISHVPESLGRLSRLEWLCLANNRLLDLPGSVFTAWSESLKHLDLRGNLLTSIPAELGACGALEVLLVSDCLLSHLPETLGGCTSLAVLAAARNALTEIPTTLVNCGALEVVDLTANKLTILPGEVVVGWRGLKELLVSNNALLALPEETGTLSQLEILAASNNQLSSLPSTLGNCTALRELYLQANKSLNALPEAIGGWAHLHTLILKACKFKTLPLFVFWTVSASSRENIPSYI